MFTGLIEEVGEVVGVRQTDAGRELRIRSGYGDIVDGESVAVNGVCLTVRGHADDCFTTAAISTTLDRTTVGEWNSGTRVNLERAIRASDRLGGHIVQGHVDFVGRVGGVRRSGDSLLIDLDIPRAFETLFVLHGSIAVDGVSLTVNELMPRRLQLSLIEYTLRRTTLSDLEPDARVHVEADVVAKHVRRLLEPFLREPSTLDSLADFSLEH